MLVLIILDGFGIAGTGQGNAVMLAKKPNFDALMKTYPHTEIAASGVDVGLPAGQQGNSEVGHMNMGAGRVVYQDLTLISKAIDDGVFFENPAFLGAIENCKRNNSALHIMGLLSDGGVHSHNTHLYALLELAARHGLKDVYVHAFTDGRDTPPQSAIDYVRELQAKMAEIGVGRIATVCGRYYIMDRDNRWERVEKGYNALVLGEGEYNDDPINGIERSYANGVTDEFIEPIVITSGGAPIAKISPNDSVINFNYRKDRAREFTRALVDENFAGFEREIFPVHYVCMTLYDREIKNVSVAYPPQNFENCLAEYIAKKGLKQFHIAETEKYAHVTFYFNGGVERAYEGEERTLIPSEKVATYDLSPKMRAFEIKDGVLEYVKSREYAFGVVNFANPDMLGHTGNISAAVTGIEAMDECLGEIIDVICETGSTAIVTADHGNAEAMIDGETGKPCTSHTTNPVPLIVVNGGNVELRGGGRLADIAPTCLELMKLPKAAEMTGESLIASRN